MTAWMKNPRSARVFRFGSRAYDPASGEIRLAYVLDDGPELLEKLVFPHAPWPPDPSRQAAFGKALEVLHLIAGVSYYKAALPRDVKVEPAPCASLGEFVTRLYVEGLAEFSFVNKVSVADRFRLPLDTDLKPHPVELLLPDRALVATGGGKDSLVGLDLMQRAGVEVMPVCVGASDLIGRTVSRLGLPLLRIHRELAPELRGLNAAGAWNGHVPVTAINSAVLLCAAILYGYRYVVFSNERSADEATLTTPDGLPVNHQYSKSSAFESDFRSVVHGSISPQLEYFSILRPFSELEIVRRFSAMTELHPVYSSCNRNFHLDGTQLNGRWCGRCPKCFFAALSLALFLTPPEVVAIQGVDLLADPNLVEGFRALCGLGRDKPFECVGEAGESRAAMKALGEREPWRHHAVVMMLAPELREVPIPDLGGLLKPRGPHFVPPEITAALADEFD